MKARFCKRVTFFWYIRSWNLGWSQHGLSIYFKMYSW